MPSKCCCAAARADCTSISSCAIRCVWRIERPCQNRHYRHYRHCTHYRHYKHCRHIMALCAVHAPACRADGRARLTLGCAAVHRQPRPARVGGGLPGAVPPTRSESSPAAGLSVHVGGRWSAWGRPHARARSFRHGADAQPTAGAHTSKHAPVNNRRRPNDVIKHGRLRAAVQRRCRETYG